jgi:uridine phosphorylase
MSLPIVSQKIEDEALFKPLDFLAYLEKTGIALSHKPAPDAIILSYQKSLFDFIQATYPCERAKGYFGRFVHYIDISKADIPDRDSPISNKTIAIASDFGVGAPAAAVMLEELIAWGAKEFISIGFAGSLREDVPPGTLVLCDSAFRDEGTSYHYLDSDVLVYPDVRLTKALENSLKETGLAYAKGPTWTTDAIYRETSLEVRYFRNGGALVADMEAAALFAVAEYRHVPIASCFSVSDTLAYLEWRPEFHAEPTMQGLKMLFSCAVKALK